MVSFKLAAVAVAAAGANAALYPGLSPNNHTCALLPNYLSCSPQAQANRTDSCCAETYGGLVLATQFWSVYTGRETTGQVLPRDSWTIHGLWPDFCNGSYTQYCDLARQYDRYPSPNTTTGTPGGTPVPAWRGAKISSFLEAFGRFDLLAFMNKYWIAQNQFNYELWEHEFSKHATCFSTFDIPCYGPKYQNGSDVIDYFDTTVAYNEHLPTWGWLSAANIRPSNTTRYALADLQRALTRGFGALPYIGCSGPRYNATDAGRGSLDNGFTQLSEAWYYYHVFGRVQRNQGLPVHANITGGSVSNCARAAGALSYPLRAAGSE